MTYGQLSTDSLVLLVDDVLGCGGEHGVRDVETNNAAPMHLGHDARACESDTGSHCATTTAHVRGGIRTRAGSDACFSFWNGTAISTLPPVPPFQLTVAVSSVFP